MATVPFSMKYNHVKSTYQYLALGREVSPLLKYYQIAYDSLTFSACIEGGRSSFHAA